MKTITPEQITAIKRAIDKLEGLGTEEEAIYQLKLLLINTLL